MTTDGDTSRRIPTSFRVRAANSNGRRVEKDFTAESVEGAIEAARRSGLWPISVLNESAVPLAHVRLSLTDLAVGFRVFATILNAGIPTSRVIHVALPSLSEQWQPLAAHIERHLQNGETFPRSLDLSGLHLPRDVRGLLIAGDAVGDLAGSLRGAAEMAERSHSLRAAVVSALAYPALLTMSGILVIGLIVAVVIPRFVAVLENLGQDLPASTRLVLNASDLARTVALPGGVILAVGTIGFAAWSRSGSNACILHEHLLTLPIIGKLRLALATARTTDALSTLLAAGMTFTPALALAAVASGDAAVEQRMLAARNRILQGASIARALTDTGALTTSAIRLIGAGESGGALSALLRHAAKLEGDAAITRLQRMTRIVEPALILLLGGIVAFVAIALLQAVYSVRPDRA